MLTLEMYGQLLGWSACQEKREEALYQMYKKAFKTTYNVEPGMSKVQFINFYNFHHPDERKKANQKIKALLCAGKQNDKVSSMMQMKALGHDVDQKMIATMCCFGPKKAVNFACMSIISGMNKMKRPTKTYLDDKWRWTDFYLENSQAFYDAFYQFDEQDKLRKELAIMILNCSKGRDGDKGICGFLKLRQLGAKNVLRNPMQLMIANCVKK